jgi:hypothetical protein
MRRTPKQLPAGWRITGRGTSGDDDDFVRGEKTLADGSKFTLYVEPDEYAEEDDAEDDFDTGYWLYRWQDANGKSGGGHGYGARSFAHAAQLVDAAHGPLIEAAR